MNDVCSIDDCNAPVKSLGWCSKHAARYYRHGDPLVSDRPDFIPNKGHICSIDGCSKPADSKGMCPTHYGRYRRHGDPLHVFTVEPKLCSLDDCANLAITRGLCDKHYCQYIRLTSDKQRLASATCLAKKRAKLNEMKLAAGCVDCGYNAHAIALDFDHRPGEDKRFTISRALTRGWAVVLAEIAKCDVRCANCHRVVTEQRRRATQDFELDNGALSVD